MSNNDRNRTYVDLVGIAHFARVQRPVKTYDKKSEEYVISKMQVTDEALEALTAAGLSTEVFNPNAGNMQSRYKEIDGIRTIKLKKRVYHKDGQQVTLGPKVTDANGDLTDALIGDGSILKVTAIVEDIIKDGQAQGRKVTLGNVQILKLIPVEAKEGSNGAASEADLAAAEAIAAQFNQNNG